MEDFDDFVGSYWQGTEAEVLPLSRLVEHYFKLMPFDREKNIMLTDHWDFTKHSIVKRLLTQKRLCRLSDRPGPFNESIYEDMDEKTNTHVYIHWHELYVRL